MINEEVIINKLKNGESLDSEEVEFLIDECDCETEYGENRRWSRYARTIIEVNIDNNLRHFMLEWENGLTEYQENEYFSQIAKEVILVEKQTIVKTWEILNKE